MPLNPTDRHFVESQLDECDRALAERPTLASIYDPAWRQEHRNKMLNARSPVDVWYPEAYAKPQKDTSHPADWQDRIEEGAMVLLPKLTDAARNHPIKRMRGEGCLSAVEELLLAWGFAREFGVDAIRFPSTTTDKPVPEFYVSVCGRTVEVEAKGLLDQQVVCRLNKAAICAGQNSWITFDPKIGDPSRVRRAAKEKLRSKQTGDARVLVLTQYTPWIQLVDAAQELRKLAVDPDQSGISVSQRALAIAYVAGPQQIVGVWFNREVARRVDIGDVYCERIRSAIRVSFYPRADGVFFDESNSDEMVR